MNLWINNYALRNNAELRPIILVDGTITIRLVTPPGFRRIAVPHKHRVVSGSVTDSVTVSAGSESAASAGVRRGAAQSTIPDPPETKSAPFGRANHEAIPEL